MTKTMTDPLERLVTILLAEQIRSAKQRSGNRYTKVVRVGLLEALEAELRHRGWNMDAVFTHMHEQRKSHHAYLVRRAEREATQSNKGD